ncbi:hypothetical protein AB1N83_013963 [Pleurotus pulmonarius]
MICYSKSLVPRNTLYIPAPILCTQAASLVCRTVSRLASFFRQSPRPSLINPRLWDLSINILLPQFNSRQRTNEGPLSLPTPAPFRHSQSHSLVCRNVSRLASLFVHPQLNSKEPR